MGHALDLHIKTFMTCQCRCVGDESCGGCSRWSGVLGNGRSLHLGGTLRHEGAQDRQDHLPGPRVQLPGAAHRLEVLPLPLLRVSTRPTVLCVFPWCTFLQGPRVQLPGAANRLEALPPLLRVSTRPTVLYVFPWCTFLPGPLSSFRS